MLIRSNPSNSTRSAILHRLTCLILLAYVTLPLVASSATATATSPAFPILLMGDSYSAGNGAGSYLDPKGCYRSDKDYAALYAGALQRAPYSQPTQLTNVACSGDTTNGFFAREKKQAPQLDAVNASYGLILLTTGGDDADFKDIVKQCLVDHIRDGRKCDSHLTSAEKLLKDGTLESRLRHVLGAIRAKANPLATITLLGYPYLEKDTGYTLTYPHHKPVEVGKRLKALEDLGDTIQQRVVSQLNAASNTNGFVFVNTKNLFEGHELSAAHSTRHAWFVAPFTTIVTSSWYHPNPKGWAEEANLLLRDSSIPKQMPIPSTPPPSPPPPPPPPPTPVPSIGPTLIYEANTAANPFDGDRNFGEWQASTGQSVQVELSLPSDISSYRCVVLLLNRSFAATDASELAGYLQLGGRVIAIGEHSGNPEFEAADQTINQLTGTLGVGLSLNDNSYDSGDTVTSNIAASPVTEGVSTLGYNWASTVAVSGLAQRTVATADDLETLIGEQNVGSGMFFLSGDSNLFSDNNNGFYSEYGNKQLVADLCP
jgi:GDSL-like Lipase/Acylhydrolase family